MLQVLFCVHRVFVMRKKEEVKMCHTPLELAEVKLRYFELFMFSCE